MIAIEKGIFTETTKQRLSKVEQLKPQQNSMMSI